MSKLTICLALQGGGAHGAFTWGVLDRLLEMDRLNIAGVSGTSAGAMNAVMLAAGWMKGGAEGAREMLNNFWEQVATPAHLSDQGQASVTQWWQSLSRHLSPYDLNPFDINPLREILNETIDFEKLQRESPVKLFIAATEVETGALRIFRETELSVSHLLASACLPRLHKTIEIEGRHYWDGGYSANPILTPLITECGARDLLTILLQPLERTQIPVSAQQIDERVSELIFQSGFMRELAAVTVLQEYMRSKPWLIGSRERRLRRARLHLIGPDLQLMGMQSVSKFDTRRSFLMELKQMGREQAQGWLDDKGADLGRASSWHPELKMG